MLFILHVHIYSSCHFRVEPMFMSVRLLPQVVLDAVHPPLLLSLFPFLPPPSSLLYPHNCVELSVFNLNSCTSIVSITHLNIIISTTSNVKGKGSFYIAQYPVRWTAQSALHFLPPLADLFIRTPTRLLREAF